MDNDFPSNHQARNFAPVYQFAERTLADSGVQGSLLNREANAGDTGTGIMIIVSMGVIFVLHLPASFET